MVAAMTASDRIAVASTICEGPYRGRIWGHHGPMRVLIVQPWVKIGGAERLSLHLAAELERLGHEAPVVALFLDDAGLAEDIAGRTFVLPSARWQARFRRSRALLYLAGPLALALLLARHARHGDVLNPHNLPAPLAAAVVGRLRGLPVVWHCNEVPRPARAADAGTVGGLERLAWRAGSLAARACARSHAAITVLADRTREEVHSAYGREATVVRAGVDRATFSPPSEPGGRDATLRLLYVAKLHPQKDPLRAVRVLALLLDRGVDARLTLVGDGPQREDVLHCVAGLGGRASLIPRVPASELARLYRESDVLLVTADDRQSWGLTPFEALACGTPSVLGSGVGATELLGPAAAAIIVEPTDEAFADAVLALARDHDLRAGIVSRGRALLEELTWAAFARRQLTVLEGLAPR